MQFDKKRLQLLAGILDSSGHYRSTLHFFELVLKEESLAKQIKFLCDSLGFKTSLKETISGLDIRYQVRISGNLEIIPTLAEKDKAPKRRSSLDWRNSDIHIVFDQVGDYYGFEIDGNRRFLLEDFTVTHNTAFVVSAMRNAAVDFERPVAIFSLEMSSIQLVKRLISSEAELESEKLRKGNLTDEEWDRMISSTTRISKAPIFIDDTPALSVMELRAKARRLKAQHDIQMIIIDYLQLMTAGDVGHSGGNREQEISYISRSLKQIAKELDVPVIALSQLSRAVETRGGDKRPQLSDLRESGAIEQDADMVIFLYRPEYYGITEDEEGNPVEGLGEVIVSKHRNGSLDTVPLRFIGRYTRFVDWGESAFESNSSFQSYEDSFMDSNLPESAGSAEKITLGSKMNDGPSEFKPSTGDAPF